jgi:secreted trypsin-like serine protease
MCDHIWTQGDSGGPIFIKDEHNKTTLIGVVSYGDSRCSVDKPFVGTRVSAYVSWIRSTMRRKSSAMSLMDSLIGFEGNR